MKGVRSGGSGGGGRGSAIVRRSVGEDYGVLNIKEGRAIEGRGQREKEKGGEGERGK